MSFHITSGRSVAAIALDTAGVVSIREREAVLLSEGKACLFPGAGPHVWTVLFCFCDESQRMLQVVQSDASKTEQNTDGAEV